ncbi:NGG1p interacting factor 3, NIF3 [Candidatus Omnitrophus magneticus]|uniref:NGG1p interacting factor 3, NIF3 n=1 Tax=Candidatus Omnitrophus magneticus TaxID=1609969 RepID=A0A0F0CPR8_9BACT|nr:NGG1p interacting factor 3, NIF3 [Candidatus Omnitrophus magneticus]
MKLKEIFDKAVKTALKNDPRSASIIKKDLNLLKKSYGQMTSLEKSNFDKESLIHPYDDSRILYGAPDKEIKTIMVGIDIDTSELLLADRFRQNGVNIDLVISHHPLGRGLTQLDKVMILQPRLWQSLGFDETLAREIIRDRMEEVARSLSGINYTRVVDFARIMDIPLICLHTAADNCVSAFLSKLFIKEKPDKLEDVLNLCYKIPEYSYAAKSGMGPYILVGDKKKKAGKILVDMTGGANGPDRIFSRLSQSGIQTIVGMHIKDSGYKIVKSEFLNYIVAGHMSSDTLGVNLLLDAVDPANKLTIIECSGFKRYIRKNG